MINLSLIPCLHAQALSLRLANSGCQGATMLGRNASYRGKSKPQETLCSELPRTLTYPIHYKVPHAELDNDLLISFPS